jgi:hypothetical protein
MVTPTAVQEVVDVAAVPPVGMLKLAKAPVLSMYNPWLPSVNWSVYPSNTMLGIAPFHVSVTAPLSMTHELAFVVFTEIVNGIAVPDSEAPCPVPASFVTVNAAE